MNNCRLGDALATSNARKLSPVEGQLERITALPITRVLVEKENLPSINRNIGVLGKMAPSNISPDADVQSLIQQVHTALDVSSIS